MQIISFIRLSKGGMEDTVEQIADELEKSVEVV